ncbi:MAG TPA: hypothetical protein VFN44_09255 [Solirubrobacteraceae bacterium]|nr:hypothetical protein [Solirubrobacteraceae bacterium]
MTRAPLTIMAVLAALLLGLWWLTDGSANEQPAPERVAPVAEIARRVEALRGLQFDSLPRPVEVTPAQARREGLEDLDRSYPEARRRADEQVLKLLGLIDPSVDLRDVSASVFSEGVAGYYDPRTKRMRTVRGAATGTKVLAEMVLAHELTHALEDQRFGLGLEEAGGSDDAALAHLALVEGSASELMYAYARRHFTPEETLGGVLGSAFAPTGSLPGFLQAQLIFPYTGGQSFVAALRERAGGRWTLVDLAERTRPPASTEQVLHPDKWVRVEPPQPVRLRAGAALGGGWKRAAGGVLGEFQTRELLADAGGGGSATAAAGWGGDRYELWRRGSGEACAAPCRGGSTLVVRWRWDTPADETEFATKLRQWVRDGLGPVDGGAVAVAESGGAVTLAMAPTARLARRLASARTSTAAG